MMINISNHPSSRWGQFQLEKAIELSGDRGVWDVQFPHVSPDWTQGEVREHATQVVFYCLTQMAIPQSAVFHVMGEMTLTYEIVRLLKEAGRRVVASTTERQSCVGPDGEKRAWFVFCQFREY